MWAYAYAIELRIITGIHSNETLQALCKCPFVPMIFQPKEKWHNKHIKINVFEQRPKCDGASKSGNSIKWNDRHRKMANNNLEWSRSTFLSLSVYALSVSPYICIFASYFFKMLKTVKQRRKIWMVFSTIIIIPLNFMWHFSLFKSLYWSSGHMNTKNAYNSSSGEKKMGQLSVK